MKSQAKWDTFLINIYEWELIISGLTGQKMNKMVTIPYLNRIDYKGTTEPTQHTLAALHQAHLYAVPFENLDIHWKRPIRLELVALYDKIVRQRRGGFCYELNGLFAWLLTSLGFEVTLLSARVYSNRDPGPEFDHLTLLIQLNEPWVVDVGFGDCFLQPLRLQKKEPQIQKNGRYHLIQTGEEITLYRQQQEQAWSPQYVFSLQPRQLSDFATMCLYHQTSPASSFTRKTICTRATENGRISLSGRRLISTINGVRQETAVQDDATYMGLLRQQFGIHPEGVS